MMSGVTVRSEVTVVRFRVTVRSEVTVVILGVIVRSGITMRLQINEINTGTL